MSADVLREILTAPAKVKARALDAAAAALRGAPSPIAMTQADVGRALSCSRFTIRRLVKDGALKPVHLRGLVRYPREQVEALVKA